MITVILVFGLPTAIGYATFFSDKFSYKGAEFVGTTLTILVSSILGVHKLMSSLMEKRKYRSHFFQAKTKLLNILFSMDETFNSLVSDDNFQTIIEPKGESSAEKTTQLIKFSLDMLDELNDAIKESREIVQTETQEYFEMSSVSTFNLGNILSESGSAAKSLIGTFKSHSYDLDKKQAAEEKVAELKVKKKEAQLNSEISIKATVMKLERLTHKEMLLLEKHSPLNNIKEPTDDEKSELRQLEIEIEIDKIQIEIETLEIECMKLRMQTSSEEE